MLRLLVLLFVAPAMSVTPGMQDELDALLAANALPVEVRKHLVSMGCKTFKNFANFALQKSEVHESFLKGSTWADKAKPENKTVLANLMQAWSECESTVSARTKRSSEGLPEVLDDDPLPDLQRKALDGTFLIKYSWNLTLKERPAASLVGRVKREFDKVQPTLYPISKVKSEFLAHRGHEAKRHRMTNQLAVLIGEEHDSILDDEKHDRLRFKFYQMEVLANAWGIAGTNVVKYGNEDVMICSWQEALQYVRKTRDKVEHLVDRFMEESVVSYLIACEENVRAAAIDLARDESHPVPWGRALLQAMSDSSDTWSSNKELLIPLRAERKDNSSNAGSPRPTKPVQPAPAPHPESPKKVDIVKAATCQSTEGGKLFCKHWNDKRGCKGNCPHGKVHRCDLRLASTGQPCNGKHKRFEHKVKEHGELMPRS